MGGGNGKDPAGPEPLAMQRKRPATGRKPRCWVNHYEEMDYSMTLFSGISMMPSAPAALRLGMRSRRSF